LKFTNKLIKLNSKSLQKTVLFAITYIILCALVIVFPYEINDADSKVYSYIGNQLAYAPIVQWCAPIWRGPSKSFELFQAHPPGIFWITALFVRIGFPGHSAALCANFLYLLLTLYIIYLLVSHFGGSAFGWGAVFGYIVTPIFLQYLIRANHEVPLNLAVMTGLYGYVRSNESRKFQTLFIVAFIFAVFIKGLSALMLVLIVLLYWILFLKNIKGLLLILVAFILTFGTMCLFELWYQNITHGKSFWQNYLYWQGSRATEVGFMPLNKAINFIWYLSRAIWFSIPWLFFALYGLLKSKGKNKHVLNGKFYKFCLFGAALIILCFFLFDRKADRYIFPAYCLLSVSGTWVLFSVKPRIAQLFQKKENLLFLYFSIILIIFTLLKIYFHTFHYSFIKFWSG